MGEIKLIFKILKILSLSLRACFHTKTSYYENLGKKVNDPTVQTVLKSNLAKTSSRHLQDVFKTF